MYQKFIKVCISLLALLGSHINKDEDQFDTNLRDVLEEKYPETDLEKLRSKIDRAEIKNIIRNTNGNKIPRFNLKLYAFVYGTMIDFPPSNFMYGTITTSNFFKNVHHLIEVNVHLHHSHITGNILGYAHDFFNWIVCENKSEIALIAHTLFGFGMLFFIEGYRATPWGTKDLNFGGEILTRINYGNIARETKSIDILKYYQRSLGELAATLSENEKNLVKQLTKQFFNQHLYFSEVWKYVGDSQKNKTLEIIAKDKGIIPYEKIVDMNSMFLTPENDLL